MYVCNTRNGTLVKNTRYMVHTGLFSHIIVCYDSILLLCVCCVHLREGQLSHELLSEEDHTCNPEKEDIVACLQERARIKHLEVLCLRGEEERMGGKMVEGDDKDSCKLRTWLGHPNMENGKRAEENHVSRTSSSGHKREDGGDREEIEGGEGEDGGERG